MSPDDVTNAITQALVQGGAQWMVATIVAFLPALWTMTLMLHLGRPYVLRTLRRCGLRLGADIWWMSYLLIRDAVLVLTFALSLVFFQPNIVATAALPITGPIAALCLLLALASRWRAAWTTTSRPIAWRRSSSCWARRSTTSRRSSPSRRPARSSWRVSPRCSPATPNRRRAADHVGVAGGRDSRCSLDLLPRHGFRWSHDDDARLRPCNSGDSRF